MNKANAVIFGLGLFLGLAFNALADIKDSPAGKIISNPQKLLHPSGKAKAIPLIHKEIGAQAAYMGLLEIEPGAGVPVHRDASEEYIYFLAGGGEITINGKKHPVKKGDAVFMPANAEVSFSANKKEKTKVLQVFAPQGPEVKYNSWKR